MNNSVKVRIRCVVDLPVGTWGGNSEFESLAKTAKEEGKQKLRKILEDTGGTIYAEPKVVFVMVEEE